MLRVTSAHCVAQGLRAPRWVCGLPRPIARRGSNAGGSGVRLHVACSYTTSWRTSMSGAHGSSSSSSNARDDDHNQTKEDEEDQMLEDEEFAALRDADGDEHMPVAHRLAHKADALDAELRRIRYCLCDRAQWLVDTAPATFSGRPTRMDKVVQLLKAAGNQQQSDGAAAKSSRKDTSAATVEAALRASPYAAWCGTSDPVLRFLSLRVLWPRARQAGRCASHGEAPSHGTDLATLNANLDHLRRRRALHRLNYYSRLNLTPKRHIWISLYQILWNSVVSAQDAVGCVVFGTLRGIKDHGTVQGACRGAAIGLVKAVEFLCYGWVVSPLLHLSRGLCNTLYGPVSSITGKYMFDALSGRWMRCTVADSRLFRHELQLEKRVLRTIGRAEFRRKRIKTQHKWADRMASMGFSVDMMTDKFMPKGTCGPQGASADKEGLDGSNQMRNPYEVLQVRRTASTQEIKKQYKKLAMVFHPDVVQSHRSVGGPLSPEEKAEAQHKFEEISSAYQVLSNPEKRKAYDLGGVQAVRLHESKFGKFMSRTPSEIVQSVFGGEGFRRVLVGELLRSHWALRNEAQVSVSIHELEELQCIRVRQVAVELAAIADVHAQRPTTPYYRGASASTGAGGAEGSRRRATYSHPASSSSLPDYLKSGKVRSSSAAATGCRRSTNGAGASAGIRIDREVHNSIMEELGGGGGAPGSGGRAAPHGAASASSSSPFVLHPGSNEYNCFSRDFEERCDRFVRYMAEACFGKPLLYEVGEAYVVGAQRFLGIRPFYAPKMLVTRKIFAGMDRIYEAFSDKTRLTSEGVSRKLMAEYFNMEYDAVVADIHGVLRYAVQMVLQDVVESDEVRRKRCYAVWYLGEKMMTVGERWTTRIANDEDLVAYIQQAATSVATTSKPPAF
ncbi:DnaJ domain-containing protein / J25 / JDP25 [Leishmania donovani]|uniref:DnaJ_domain_containing_protein_-_putative n=4 Tax=Leishmania donovani species complex TaxID=38574 RepID=A0A6L0XFT6_LEIIN|nr:DnaJ_domain_containing_protein_-_putative [Leishmania infantum]CAJ1989713.1 DnaJ domain-containing protein / J25 / JDP25 [Leishmania donovani]SUZ42717.1 DnaJ_domain_containing_protein_-_putative [Leishmania infantum]